MSVSTSSIFHYTRTINNLISIINDGGFRLKYCLETIQFNNSEINIAIPMVSFCDIPFTSVSDHVNEYGKYGIGMKKEWALTNGINPIFYIDKGSYIASSMVHLNTAMLVYLDKTNQESNSETCDESAFSYINICRNMKNYKGNLLIKNGKKNIIDYEFYKEREWRYIPGRFQLESAYSKDEYIKNKKAINDNAKNTGLYFSIDDISYIILEKNTQVEFISKRIRKKINPEFYSKVITLEQIRKDF